jgi:hypothetical protein
MLFIDSDITYCIGSALRKGQGVPEGLSKIIAVPLSPFQHPLTLLSCFALVFTDMSLYLCFPTRP